MAIELTPGEEERLSDLEKNMQQRLSAFEKQNQGKSKEELEQELSELDEYLQGCYNSEIDDTETNIRFTEGKSTVLKRMIEKIS